MTAARISRQEIRERLTRRAGADGFLERFVEDHARAQALREQIRAEITALAAKDPAELVRRYATAINPAAGIDARNTWPLLRTAHWRVGVRGRATCWELEGRCAADGSGVVWEILRGNQARADEITYMQAAGRYATLDQAVRQIASRERRARREGRVACPDHAPGEPLTVDRARDALIDWAVQRAYAEAGADA